MNKSTKIITLLLVVLLAIGLLVFLFLVKPFFDLNKKKRFEVRPPLPQEEISIESSQNDFMSGNPEKSLGTINQFLEENPESTEGNIVKAQILSNIGSMKFDEEKYAGQSIQILDQILATDPNNVDALYAKGYALEIQNKFDEALELYEQASVLSPENEIILNQIGHLYDLMGKEDLALQYYNQALAIDGTFDRVLLNLARHYLFNGDNDKATELFTSVTVHSKDFRSLSEAYHALGNIYSNTDLDQALVYMRTAYEYNPEYPNAMIGFAWIQFQVEINDSISSGREYNEKIVQESYDLILKSIQIHPEQTSGYLTLARMQAYFPSMLDLSIENYEKALEVVDQDISILGTDRTTFKKSINDELENFRQVVDAANYQSSNYQEEDSFINKILKFVLQPEVAYAGCVSDPVNGDRCDSQEEMTQHIANLNAAGHTTYDNGDGTATCVNGNSIRVVTPPPPPPVHGACGSSNGRYYPSAGDITNKCSSGDASAVTTRPNGTFSWICEGRHGGNNSGTCATVTNPFGGGGGGSGDDDDDDDEDVNSEWLSCRFNNNTRTDLDNSSVGDQISVQSIIANDESILDPLGFKFAYGKGQIFVPSNGIVFTPAPDNVYRSAAIIRGPLNEYGAYQIQSSFKYFDQFIGAEMCLGNFDDLFAPLNIPEISFSIDPELANEENKCVAEIEVKAIDSDGRTTEPVKCSIVTENGVATNSDANLINGFNSTKEVVAGTSYKLKCEIASPVYGPALNASGRFDHLLQTALDRCVVNPNLRQN